jgi:ADP-dependent NAD(P)H-hydrate dehydratase / NAD(P)H-hydrate epimerase
MEPLPAEVHSAAQVRAMDRHAIEKVGIPGYELMRRAGGAALASLRRNWPDAEKILVVCGAGNNGGDGYVLARLAASSGIATKVAALSDPQALSGDAARAYADFAQASLRHERFEHGLLADVDVVIDALLGTGIDRPVGGALRDCIEAINASGRPVLALDVPSGLDAETGAVQGAAIRATRTITFVGLKCGLFLGAAPDHAGELEYAGLDLPAAAREGRSPVLRRMTAELLAEALPPRRRTSHKGDHGRVLIVGGFSMAGAARLAAEAALRTGAGLVTVATSAASAQAIVGSRPELICRTPRSSRDFAQWLESADAVAIGPGLGVDARARRLFDAAIASDRALVVDADALTLLAKKPRRHSHWILTPHPGEAARLLATDAAAIQRDRLGAVKAVAERFGGVCVLKGAGTLVHAPDKRIWVCDRGGPAMATAGSGDVLTGIVAALAATGCAPALAAASAVLVHALAGDRASGGRTRGLIAGDFLAALPGVVNPPWS